MSAYLYNIPAGIAGSVSKLDSATVIEPNVISATNPPLAYGVPVKVDATGIHPIGAGNTNADVYGVLVRSFVGTDVLLGGVASVLKIGYVSVVCNGSATPVKGGRVYVRTVTGSDTVIGGFSAASDSTNSFVLVGAHWTGGKDANGNAEIYFNHTV